jgi:hypothetical protein
MLPPRSIRLGLFLWLAVVVWITGCASFREYQQDREIQRLESAARKTEDDVRNRLDQSPDSILSESLRTLDAILEYADRVKSDPMRFDSARIEEYTRKIDIIRTNLERFKDLKLQADISFPLGAYRVSALSPAGRVRLGRLKDRIVKTAKDLGTRYPGHPIRITLKTIGYTDLGPILPDSALEAALQKEVKTPAPSERDRQRQYNQALSRLRSVSVNRYLKDLIRRDLPGGGFQVELKHIGKGESFPLPRITPPYKAIDPRRRICIISPFIEIVI